MTALLPIGHEILRFDELDSTNSFLLREKQYLRRHGLVVITRSQVGGRGRAGRRYVAVPGKNITFSVVVHPLAALGEVSVYALLAGLAVARGLEKYTRTKPRLKWPNDVLVGHRKVCGILLEAAPVADLAQPVLVMGIGINCLGSAKEFPEELKKTITTLEEESEHVLDQETVFQDILHHIEQVLHDLQQQGLPPLLQEWQAYSDSIGAKVRYETPKGWSQGTIEGLTAVGYLLIRNDSGELQTHLSGDVVYTQSPYAAPHGV